MNDQILSFTKSSAEERLDKFLVVCLPDLSRSRIQALIKDGFVSVGDKIITKNGMLVASGQTVTVQLPPPQAVGLIPETIPLAIVYEDKDLMIVNKPAGMVVHPSFGHSSGTLVHAALAHAPEMEGIGGEIRPGVVHRLDKDTSGLIVLAKNDRMMRWLQDQFRNRLVEKTYLALVDGQPPTLTGRIVAAIGRDPSQRKKMAIVPDQKGRNAISEYTILETFIKHTLLSVKILTGRTHQIRLHLAFLGCPVVGDTIYGHRHASLPLNRQFLHAANLKILFPGEKTPRSFDAELPEDLRTVLSTLV